MSIRAGILAVLSQGEAYGLQIHGELEERSERVGRINVGQIYSTLDRLSKAALVRPSGATDDGLPLYRLSERGHDELDRWLAGVETADGSAWSDMTFRVLVAASLPGFDVEALLADCRRAWTDVVLRPATSASQLADRRLAEAALAWIGDLEALPGGASALARPLRNERPRRGRRPSTPQ
jgi:DNA-binding PadR family transcriptional regulator